jgi:hypothetical protein
MLPINELIYLIEKGIGMFSLLYEEIIGKTRGGEFICHR